ncbi:hypothetical protein HNP48_001485 [Acidovorax soli]|uniref:Uncharacterized protein n=1 Tax=Acidovorax soli TaxID=592050 RepID=A0A7X0PBJ9_9BURK|nr:hypothetical protein [Acidovorax soli]
MNSSERYKMLTLSRTLTEGSDLVSQKSRLARG